MPIIHCTHTYVATHAVLMSDTCFPVVNVLTSY